MTSLDTMRLTRCDSIHWNKRC